MYIASLVDAQDRSVQTIEFAKGSAILPSIKNEQKI